MKIALLSTTERVPLAAVEQIAGAVNKQLAEVCEAWGFTPWTMVAAPYQEAAPADALRLWILDKPGAGEEGILGEHDDPDGRPQGRVFAAPTLDTGGQITTGSDALSVTVSHEAVEMVGDLTANAWAEMPSGTFVAWELCDAVEGDSYEIDGVSVSNYVLPTWFDGAAKGPYDRLGKLVAPFTMTPGGYLILAQAGRVSQVFGAAMPPWKRALKKHSTGRAGRRRREAVQVMGAAALRRAEEDELDLAWRARVSQR